MNASHNYVGQHESIKYELPGIKLKLCFIYLVVSCCILTANGLEKLSLDMMHFGIKLKEDSRQTLT